MKDLEALKRELSNALSGFRSARYRPGRITAFPDLRRARVLALQLEDSGGDLGRIFGRVSEALSGAGFCSHEKRYVPHVTLARVRGRRAGKGLSILPGSLPVLPGSMHCSYTADRVVLYCSETHPRRGTVYSAGDIPLEW